MAIWKCSLEMNNNLLIVGGTGFIGKHLVREAIKQGYIPTILSLQPVKEEQVISGVDYLVADITDFDMMSNKLLNNSFHYVVNLSGYINHDKYKEGGRKILDAHFVGVQNLIEILNWNVLKSFVQIGSSDEYGDAPAPQSEKIREKPISSYSMGKLAASQLLQMLYRTEKFPVVILRLFLVYGPGQDSQRFLPQIIQGCLKGETFATSHGQQQRDFCYVDDIVNGIILALKSSNVFGKVLNLASGMPVSIRTVLEEVVNIIGKGKPLYGEVPYRNGENMELYADVVEARQALNWKPEISLRDGLVRTINSYVNIQDNKTC